MSSCNWLQPIGDHKPGVKALDRKECLLAECIGIFAVFRLNELIDLHGYS